MVDILLDTTKDSLRLIPFLFLAYLLMEILEKKSGEPTRKLIKKAGSFGPAVGGILGAVPQCGFSAVAANLYSGGVITLGTLFAVFLSTSDEMLPIFISESVDIKTILKILLAKVMIGMLFGFLIDLTMRKIWKFSKEKNIHDICEHEHCHCEDGVFISSLKHTIKITIYIFLVSFIINIAVELIGQDNLAAFILNKPIVGCLLAGLVGLIPNCAASVVITQLYLEGILASGAMIAGLLVSAGVGILVLFHTNRNWKENLTIVGLLYFAGVVFGWIVEGMSITF